MKKKSLVVFYSLQGYTKEIAELIKEKTDGDIYEIKLEKPYSVAASYTLGLLHTKTNHKPKIINENLNIAEYDNVYIGSPIWWFTLTPPIASFLKKYDLTGKTVIPFCTHKGNFGDFFKKFKEISPNSMIISELEFYDEKNQNKEEIVKKISRIIDSL